MKLASRELKKLLTCIKPDPKVLVPPKVGFDAGVHKLDDKLIAVATDPCTGVPEEWFGWLLINYAASDVALFGAQPEFCTITLMAPLGTKPNKFQTVMKQTCKAADELDMAIVRGHTGTYSSLSELVGVCTAYGTVEPKRLITPADAKPGDLILCTKPIGLETAINFSLAHKAQAQKLFGNKKTEKLSQLVTMQSCVKEAMQLAGIEGVHAMHDATEGGFTAAMNELAEASNLGFRAKFEKLPIQPEARTLQKTFKLTDEQLLAMSSTGTILAVVDAKAQGEVEEVLSRSGLKGSFIGEFKEDKKRILIKEGKETGFPLIGEDPYSRILSWTN